MADEGLHEIQLNGKQLVFLFMASTVVAVVIFLCGVMVGRGVPAQRPAEAIETSVDAAGDPTAFATTPTAPATTATSPTSSNTPVAASEILTYPNRLEGRAPEEEVLKQAPAPSGPEPFQTSAKVAAAPRVIAAAAKTTPTKTVPKLAPAAAAASASESSSTAGASAIDGEPAGNGFVVQVAAVTSRNEADAIAKRLLGKGYPTFVTTPGNGAPKMFRVRVGKYPSRRDAESIAAKLEKDEQFKPWITK
jgi:septal ring-binding cell division protein DamX